MQSGKGFKGRLTSLSSHDNDLLAFTTGRNPQRQELTDAVEPAGVCTHHDTCLIIFL